MRSYLAGNSAPLGRVGVLLFLALLLDHGFATGLAAQTRTNLAGSVTSETMTVLWVARDRGLFKNNNEDALASFENIADATNCVDQLRLERVVYFGA